MSTTLFLRNTVVNGLTASDGAPVYDMTASTGTGTGDTGKVNTSNLATIPIQWTKTAGGLKIYWVSGRTPAGGFTFNSTSQFIYFIYAFSSSSTAHAGVTGQLFLRDTGGGLNLIGTIDCSAEIATAAGVNTFDGTQPAATAFAEDERLWVEFSIYNHGGMAGSQNVTMQFFGSHASLADSRLRLGETLTFKAETSTASGAGAADGLATVLAIGVTLFSGAGVSHGAGVALAVGASRFAGVGASTGTSTAAARSDRQASGSSAGAATAAAIGRVGVPAAGVSHGIATASGVSLLLVPAVGNAAGVGAAVAVGGSDRTKLATMTAHSSAVASGSRIQTGYWVVQSNGTQPPWIAQAI